MKRNQKLLGFLLAVVMLLSACSMFSYESTNNEGTTPSATDSKVSSQLPPDTTTMESRETTISNPDEKIISRYNLSLETVQFDDSLQQIQAIVQQQGAYLDYFSVNNSVYEENPYRSAYYTIRVEQSKTTALLEELKTYAGHVMNESSSKENVTAQYQDLESRLNVLNKKEERLTALLEKAENVSDLIQIETSLSETIIEKEQVIAQMQAIDTDVKYNYVQVSLQEVKELSTRENAQTTFLERLANAIRNAGITFINALQNLIVFIIYLIPFIAFILLIGLAVRWFLAKYGRQARKGAKTKFTQDMGATLEEKNNETKEE